MQSVTDPEAFRAAPRGRYCAGACWVAWCWDASLCGSIVWGRPSEDDARALVRMFDIETAMAPQFDAVTDSSRMELVAPAAFAVVADYLRTRLPVLIPRMRKNALVTPSGLIGAAIAGLYPLLRLEGNWKPVRTMPEALSWLDTDAASAAGPELERLATRLTALSPLRHRLHGYLRVHLHAPSIDEASLALGMSRRSLQRALANESTRFRDELEAVRIEEAQRRLAEGEDKLEALASELGFSSVSHFGSCYFAATGETPGQFRARYRPARE